MNLTSEVSLDQIDDWFNIGRNSTSFQDAPRGIKPGELLGRLMDNKTKAAYIPEEPDFEYHTPAYRRANADEEIQELYQDYIQKSKDNVLIGEGETAVDDAANRLDQLEVDSTLCGSVADFAPEGATEVYDNFNFEHRYDPKLPISRKAQEVVLTIESNQVTVIQGSTGSGKTTQVPQFILDHYAAKGEYCNIIVTQPRRIAAMSIAKRVSTERDWPLGSVVGYQIGLDTKMSEDTRILYCTTGVLREKLIGKKNMHQFTHVILDEVHERDQESDFALLVVKKLLRTNSQHVKVVLMSATMNSAEFANYFSLPVMNVLEPAPVVNVEGEVFTVSRYFADDLRLLGTVPSYDECRPELHPQIVDIAVQLIKEFDKLEIKEQGQDPHTGYATVRGSVLVFLPGLNEIIFMLDKLRGIEDSKSLTLIPLHSSITIDEQQRVFDTPARGYRKVILSTNIAESSITVPDIKYVIDFCLTKNLVCDIDTHYTHLELEWASHSNCTQRKGRAGRVSQGRCYVMVTEDFYNNYLRSDSIPEMQRCPLNTLVLKTKLLNMGEPLALLSQALSPPDLNAIEKTILELKQVGALCITSDGVIKRFDGDLTFVGRVMADLPVDIRIAKLMILGYVLGLLDECIIIAAALSLKSIFATPFQSRHEAFKNKYRWASGSLSDCQAILQAYKVWEKCKELQEFKRSGRSERQWGEKNFIQTRRINEVHELVRELKQRLEKFNLVKVKPLSEQLPQRIRNDDPGELSPMDSLLLKVIISGAFYPHYFYKKNVEEKDAVRELSNNDPVNTVVVRGLPQNQGALYRDKMVKLFSVCCPPGLKPTIDFEETRGYIKFPRSGMEEAQTINPAVCLAIKLRQLRIPLSVDVYDQQSTNDIKRKMFEAHEQVAAQGFLRTNRVSGADPASSSEEQNMVALPPLSQSVVEISVSAVVQCGHFFAQHLDPQHFADLNTVNALLNPASKLTHLTLPPHKGLVCAAPYEDQGLAYYRGRIESLESRTVIVRGAPKSVRLALIIFVDYGNREHVPVEHLRALPSEAAAIRWRAFECELTEIRPSSVKCPDGKWTPEANTVFTRMVLNKVFLAEVFSMVRGRMRVVLVQRGDRGQEVYINEQLVSLKLADKAEESYLSKQDHDWRQLEATNALATQDRHISAAPPQAALCLNFKAPDSAKRRGRKIQLVGPISPLEMEFVSMTFAGSFRLTRVDPESVNSAAVDASPQNKFIRLMVAAYTSSNPEGRTIIARDTTIMPQIPGMPAIMALLFSPVVEMRVDRDRKRYTGALCGLGCNPNDRNLPLLPDTDMELAFDCPIDDDDIFLVNGVRHAINLALGSRSNMAEWGPDAVAQKIQVPARQQLVKLLHRTRDFKEPEYFRHDYRWGQLSPHELLAPEEYFDTDYLTLLPPHSTVALLNDDMLSVDLQREHIDELHRISNLHLHQAVTCLLCNMTLNNSQMLALHLSTERHQRKEQKVFQHYLDD